MTTHLTCPVCLEDVEIQHAPSHPPVTCSKRCAAKRNGLAYVRKAKAKRFGNNVNRKEES